MPRRSEKGTRRKRDKKPVSNAGESRNSRKTKSVPSRPSTSSREPLRSSESPPSQRTLQKLLEGIGSPAEAPFKPDPFQLDALAAVEHQDVLVTAPTGSGKTWIAREEIRRLLEAGRRAWYTSPLKALTNSKYQEFADEFGADRVGILTGDRKENANAPLIVGTTEIYRNQLFDALRGASNIEADLVVLDEAHYLADDDRGHVWEEAIILSPSRVRLLLLSATIGNAAEFATWMEEVRGVPCAIISRPGARPVPLRAAFIYPEGQLAPLLDEHGNLHPEIERLSQRQEKEKQMRSSWRSRRGGYR